MNCKDLHLMLHVQGCGLHPSLVNTGYSRYCRPTSPAQPLIINVINPSPCGNVWDEMTLLLRHVSAILWIFLSFVSSLRSAHALSLLPSTLGALDRRSAILKSVLVTVNTPSLADNVATTTSTPSDKLLQVVKDPESYSALAYGVRSSQKGSAKPPLILVLHGAGKNDLDILSDLGDPRGEHAGLIPSLIASGQAPSGLLENFAVLAPYSQGKASFYQDTRSNLLQFVDWAIQNQGTDQCPISFDPKRIILFGFSDGATVAVELLTTSRFAGGVICSYGYNGPALPSRALERLQNKPMWVFHSADDVIFDVRNSDRLMEQLRAVNAKEEGKTSTMRNTDDTTTKYSRYDKDPESLPPRVRGHSMGITASKQAAVYDWMLQVPPIA